MDFAAARYKMVQNQIRTNRVTDPLVIAAMSELPRERFVPEELRGIAYVDEDIPLGGGRFLMEPMVSGLLLQAAEVGSEDIALIVGCGTGYNAAVLARMAAAVVALESDEGLAARATATLAELELETAAVVVGSLRQGWPPQAPYDVVIFDGAIASVPANIADQVAEGGRIVAVVGGEKGVGCGTLMLRQGSVLSGRRLFDAAVPWLPEFLPEPTFRF
jgi:protein-L-isoaspartate(D-aspartate) O-methyltransferase